MESQVVLTRNFANHLTQGKHPYTFALHEGKGRNPHAHIFISERGNDGVQRTREQYFRRANSAHPERGGAPKNRDFQQRAWLANTRRAWAERTNHQLEQEGRTHRIDHRSYEEQGLLKVPTQHVGPKLTYLERRGMATDRVDRLMAVADEAKLLEAERDQLRRDIEQYQAQLKRDRSRGHGLGY